MYDPTRAVGLESTDTRRKLAPSFLLYLYALHSYMLPYRISATLQHGDGTVDFSATGPRVLGASRSQSSHSTQCHTISCSGGEVSRCIADATGGGASFAARFFLCSRPVLAL